MWCLVSLYFFYFVLLFLRGCLFSWLVGPPRGQQICGRHRHPRSGMAVLRLPSMRREYGKRACGAGRYMQVAVALQTVLFDIHWSVAPRRY